MRMLAATIILGVTVDLLSIMGWGSPSVGSAIAALLLLLLIAIAATRNLRYGMVAIILELLWGSHGHLFELRFTTHAISFRIALSIIVLAATCWHLRRQETRTAFRDILRTHPTRWPALAFGASLVLALLLGILRHPFAQVYVDANAWGFLLLVPTFLIAGGHDRRMEGWMSERVTRRGGAPPRAALEQGGGPQWQDPRAHTFTGWSRDLSRRPLHFALLLGSLYLIFRTYLLLFIFSHDLGGLWTGIYQWVRDTRLGEITVFPGGFPRIFMPSMALLFPAILLAGSRMFRASWMTRMECIDDVNTRMPLPMNGAIFGGGVTVLLISLSRSYWVGLGALIVMGCAAVVARIARRTSVPWRAMGVGTLATILGIILAVIVVRLPYPRTLTTAGIGATLLARLAPDAAVSNRWQQLGPLRTTIAGHPIFGNGFGTAVTYESKDPRTLAAFPDGTYTTTAFEWGYLDDLLERGFVGLLIELWFIAAVLATGLRRGGESAALALGLLAIVIVHATSPYLNHALGIGALALAFAAARTKLNNIPRGPLRNPPPVSF